MTYILSSFLLRKQCRRHVLYLTFIIYCCEIYCSWMVDFVVWFRLLTWSTESCCLCRWLWTPLDFCATSTPRHRCCECPSQPSLSVGIWTSSVRPLDSTSCSTRRRLWSVSPPWAPWPTPCRTRGNCRCTIRSRTRSSLTRIYLAALRRRTLLTASHHVTLWFPSLQQDFPHINQLTSCPHCSLRSVIPTLTYYSVR